MFRYGRDSANVWGQRRDWTLNNRPSLLIHGDGTDESQVIKDSGATGHTITANGTAQIDTSESKWGGSSILFNGNSDYLSIPDHADWDISTNWTVDLWTKPNSVDFDIMVEQYEDNNNYWYIATNVNQSFHFIIVGVGAVRVELRNDGIWKLPDYTAFHHVAACKVGNEYGGYLDGVQLAHTSDADMDTFAGSIYIGSHGGSIQYFDGWLDEIRIAPFNVFSAAPVVGLTDTITIPTQPYISWS